MFQLKDHPPTTRRLVGILISVLLVLGVVPASMGIARAADDAEAGTWFESAYATWTGTAADYRAYVRTLGAVDWRDDSPITGWLADWDEVDAELVRPVDPARDTWRVDVPGLPKGEYELQVRAADGTTVVHTFTELQTSSYPRNGAAFVPSNQVIEDFPGTNNFALNGATGGYLPDGRVDPNAIVTYLTPQTMSTLPTTLFSAGRGATANERTPLVLRVLGTIGSFTTVAATKAAAGADVPPGVNDSRMLAIGNGNGNVTVEGIGADATLFGWGITTAGAHNVEFRNLHFDQWYDDAIFLDGGGTGVRSSNLWVHNNSFGYGQNKHLALGQDPDQAKGDGAVDISNHSRNYTVDYNAFQGSSKVMLIGGGATSISAHYGTVDHNWFLGSEERTPRVRNGRIHVFNNLYENIQGHPYHNQLLDRNTGYGIGAGHNATIWAEGNIFDSVNFPFLRSRQGHARGFQAIDYEPGPDESATANAGFNHFFGDAPGFIVAREDVTEGDFPDTVDGFRNTTDYLPGLTQTDLDSLREAALELEPNVLDSASQTNFNPGLDIGIVVAAGSTTTNPAMSTNPAAQFDWSFRPNREGVWPTGTPEQTQALRTEIETRSGALKPLAPTAAPVAPQVSSVTINDEVRSAISSFIPAPGKIVVYPDTFTINWTNSDVLTTSYELQWDQGSNDWTTLKAVPANARPTTFTTQEMNQFAIPETVHLLATAASRDATYAFRVRAVNSSGNSAWSNLYVLNGHQVSFDTDGGSVIEPVAVADGDAVARPADPSREGAVFRGWSADAACAAPYDFGAEVTTDLTLYACWVVTSSLDEAIADARALEPDDYTASTWAALVPVLAAAQDALADVTSGDGNQAVVDAATASLTSALTALARRGDPAVVAALVSAGDALVAKSGGFTDASVAALRTALTTAKAVYADRADKTQAQLDSAAAAVQTAINGLVVKAPSADKSVLKSVYDGAIKLSNSKGAYTASSWAKLQVGLAAAKAVLNNPAATQSQIDGALRQLGSALVGLTPSYNDTTPVQPKVSKVKLNQSQLRLVKGKSLTLEDAVYYRNAPTAYTGGVTWKSSNTRIATVSSDGRVKAKKAGTVTITATTKRLTVAGKKVSTSIKVTVVNKLPKAKVTKVTAPVPRTMTKGQVIYVTGTYSSSKAAGVKVSYKSSKAKVVEVDRVGRLIAKGKGTATITIKAGSKTKTYKVTVK